MRDRIASRGWLLPPRGLGALCLTACAQPQSSKRFSCADTLRRPEGERWELIDGEGFAMSPAPTRRHQAISRDLGLQIANYLVGRDCEVHHAPFDVRLPDSATADDEDTRTVVQPDLAVICDRGRLDERGCRGAPDCMIEILSPESAQRDLQEKPALDGRHGVREYWVVDRSRQVVLVFRPGPDSRYGKPTVFGPRDKASSSVLPQLAIDLEPVFAA